MTAEVLSQDATHTKVKASGSVGDRTSLTARLVLERYNLADRTPHGAAIDARVRAEMRKMWAVLHGVGKAAGSGPLPAAIVAPASGRVRLAATAK